MAETVDEYRARKERIGWLDGIIKSYEDDAEMFGLTPSDDARLSAWRKERKALSESKVASPEDGK